MDSITSILIEKYSPMWTNKQVWEFEQIHQDMKYDVLFANPKNNQIDWNSKLAHPKCEIRDTVIRNFDYLADGYELWISNANEEIRKLDEGHIPYLMALMSDIVIDEEITLKFRIDNDCIIVSVDFDADVIDCKEFLEPSNATSIFFTLF